MPDLNVHYVEMNKIMSKIHIKKVNGVSLLGR